MKKVFLSLALLVMAVAASAQTIKVSFKQGEVRNFNTKVEASVGVPMQGEQKVTSEATQQYTVKEAGADGYTIELKTVDFNVTGSKEVANQIADGTMTEAMKKTPAILKLNAKGEVVDIANADDVLASAGEIVVGMINKMYEEHPELEKMMPKSKMLMAANEKLTKEEAVKSIREASIFSLNGKDITSGSTVDETLMDMIKVKSTYTVKSTAESTEISRNSASNMTDNDIKELIKKQMESSGMDASMTSMIDSQWDQMKAMGMTRLDLNSKATLNYDGEGWLTSSANNNATSVMGATVKVNITTTAQ